MADSICKACISVVSEDCDKSLLRYSNMSTMGIMAMSCTLIRQTIFLGTLIINLYLTSLDVLGIWVLSRISIYL